MAVDIKLKRSSVPGKIPTTASLELGEIALNTHDGKAYMKKQVGKVQSIVEIGSGSGGGGGVTSVSVTTANGFAGSVANPTTTPAITISSTVVGILKGNGTSVSAANAGTDYITPTQGTASWATNAITASYFSGSISNAVSASYASYSVSASYALNSTSASYALTSVSASYALNSTSASYAFNATSASYTQNATSASYANNATSASYANNATSASYALNSTSASYAVSAGYAPPPVSVSYAATASYAGNFTVAGTLTAQTIVVQVITSSTELVTGSLTVSGSLNALGGVTGSLLGTASWANNAVSASYALTATSSSYASASTSASYAFNATSASYTLFADSSSYASASTSASYASSSTSASYALNSTSASYALTAVSASYVLNAVSASYASSSTSASYANNATSASYASNSDQAQTASYVLNAVSASYAQQAQNAATASYVLNAVSASYASSSTSASFASNAAQAQTASYVLLAVSASYASASTSASYALNSTSASYSNNSTSASYALNATSASYSNTSTSASNALFATSASYANNAENANNALSASYSLNSTSASYALTSTSASYANNATSASYSLNSTSASYSFDATSASYALNSTSASYSNNSTSASYALNATSASYAANGGVTQILAGPNITVSPLSGKGQVTISSTGTGSASFNTATGSYGSFYDTTTQTNPVANVARSMSFNETAITNGVSISGSTNPFNTYIKTENAGVYNIQFSAQLDKTDSGEDNVQIWLRKNGIDLIDTATALTLPKNNTKLVAAWNWFVQSAADDYYQIIWASDDTSMRLFAEASSSIHPGIPSVILTVDRVDQFLSNTGSFSGSFNGEFTGSLLGTSSFAISSSYSSFAISASYASASTSASYASASTSASYAVFATSASYASASTSASYASASTSASYASASTSASYAVFATSASYASASTSASYAVNATTASYALNATSASYSLASTSASYASASTSASYAAFATSASFATQANNAFTASSADNFLVRGTLTAQTIVVQTITSSISVVTGSMTVSGALVVLGGITGSLNGTASWANNATTASYALTSTSASYANNSAQAQTASYVLLAVSASYASSSTSASYAVNSTSASFASNAAQAQTASYVLNAVSASYAQQAQNAATASYVLLAVSSSYASSSTSASYALNATSASFASNAAQAQTASYVLNAVSASYAANATSASYALNATSASYSLNSTSASYALNSTSASYALTASFVPTSSLTGNFFVQGGNSFGTQALLGTNDTQNLAIETNGSVRMFISSSGNVGIGTSIPSQKLQLQDGNFAIVSTYSSGSNNILFSGGNTTGGANNTTARIRNISTAPGGAATGDLLFTVNSGDTFVDALYIASNGNIGIGTATPNAKLQIEGNNIIVNTEGSPQLKSIYFRYSNEARIQSDSYFTFYTGGSPTEKMRITSEGSVGIGTTAPGATLDVSGSIRARGITNEQLILDWDQSATGSWSHVSFRQAGVNKYRIWGISDGNISFYNDTIASHVLYLTSAGNVGIGTTNPSLAKLQIQGNVSASSYTGSLFGTASFAVSASWAPANNLTGGSTNYVARWASTTLLTTGSLYDTGIAVGIGTISPFSGTELDVWGDIVLMQQNWALRGNNAYADFAIEELSGGIFNDNNVKFYIQSGGNVGIGITAPVNVLHVHGSSDGLGYIRVTDSVTGATATDGLRIGYNSGVLRFQNYENSDIQFLTNNTTEAIRIKNNGYIGINTTAPGADLVVYQSTGPALWLIASGSGTGGLRILKGDSGTAYINNQDNSDIHFQTVGNTKMILTNVGNVGIGTVIPANKLQVEGGADLLGLTRTSIRTYAYQIGSDGSLITRDITGNSDRLTLNTSGNLGIGTATPSLATLQVQGNVSASSYTGSLFGTASFATSASYALTSTSASYAITAGNALLFNNTGSSVFATTGSNTYNGNQTVSSGYVVLSQVSASLNFVDDAAAAANGVPLGGLYRNGNFIMIRIS